MSSLHLVLAALNYLRILLCTFAALDSDTFFEKYESVRICLEIDVYFLSVRRSNDKLRLIRVNAIQA
jgi:hypothetical protein